LSLRIIAGQHKGRKLHSVKGNVVRPTPDRVREALFNILGEEVVGSVFFDLFAGTGAVGLEALSRGAARIVLLEQDERVLKVLKKNVDLLDPAPEEIRLLPGDAFLFDRVKGADFIFTAPPYPRIQEMGRFGRHLGKKAESGTIWILQHPKTYKIKGLENYWEMLESREYGFNVLTFFEKLEKSPFPEVVEDLED